MEFYTSAYLHRGKIYIRGYRDGDRFSESFYFNPFCYIKSNKETPYKTIDGDYLQKKVFDGTRDFKEFYEKYKDIDNFKLYGFINSLNLYSYLQERYNGAVDYDPSLIRSVNIDIETASDDGFPNVDKADKEVIAITLSYQGKKIVLGMGDFKNNNPLIKYIKCENERKLLRKFVEIWVAIDPDVVTGWNIKLFDMPYLYHRISNMFDVEFANKLSPFGIVKEQTVFVMGREQTKYDIYGVNQLDYMDLYKKFSFKNEESYTLDHIAHVVLGKKKIDYSEYDSLHDLYLKNYQKFIEYNIRDVALVDELEEMLGFIEQAYAIAYDAIVIYDDVFTSVRIWDVIIHNYLIKQGIVIPSEVKQKRKDRPNAGGYVKTPIPGLYKWIVSVDLNSLYPHLLMQYNISPETFIDQIEEFGDLCDVDHNPESCVDKILDGYVNDEVLAKLKENNIGMSASGCLFTNEKQGFIPAIMQSMYDDRKIFKKKMIDAEVQLEKATDEKDKKKWKIEKSKYNNMQMAKKTLLNAGYGAISNEYFRWFDLKLAESITLSGQLSIRFIANELNALMNKLLETKDIDYVIAIDTDSVYLNMETFIEKFYKGEDNIEGKVNFLDDTFSESFEPFIDKKYQKLAKMMNAYQQKMVMAREVIADKGIWTGKKRYILNVWDKEGVRYDKAKHKIMGIEAVRSSTPSVCRDLIKDSVEVIMNSTEADMIEYIAKAKEKIYNSEFEAVAFSSSVKDISKYTDSRGNYTKGVPIHVRGSIVYNKLLEKNDLTNRYNTVKEGDKIKYCYLKEPNPLMENIVSVPGMLPRALNLEQYIDYETQFEKGFLKPIKTILNAINWNTEHVASLDDFFG